MEDIGRFSQKVLQIYLFSRLVRVCITINLNDVNRKISLKHPWNVFFEINMEGVL